VLERLGGIAGAWIASILTDLVIVLAVAKDFVGCLWYSSDLYGGADKSECQELHRVLHTLNVVEKLVLHYLLQFHTLYIQIQVCVAWIDNAKRR